MDEEKAPGEEVVTNPAPADGDQPAEEAAAEAPNPLRWEDEPADASTECEDQIFRKYRIAKRVVVTGWILATVALFGVLVWRGALHERMAKVTDFFEGCAGCAGGGHQHEADESQGCGYRHCGAPIVAHRDLVLEGETTYLIDRDVVHTQTLEVPLCRVHARAAEKGWWLDRDNLSSRLLKTGAIAIVGGILVAGCMLLVLRLVYGRQFIEDLTE